MEARRRIINKSQPEMIRCAEREREREITHSKNRTQTINDLIELETSRRSAGQRGLQGGVMRPCPWLFALLLCSRCSHRCSTSSSCCRSCCCLKLKILCMVRAAKSSYKQERSKLIQLRYAKPFSSSHREHTHKRSETIKLLIKCWW